jgi:hypothetical protein
MIPDERVAREGNAALFEDVPVYDGPGVITDRSQGFEVPKNSAAWYRRSFSIPKDWAERRIKLRFDSVYSDSRVLVNGQDVGRHVGGFTPFEFDITDVLHFEGENLLALAVKRESPADLQMTTFGTAYANTPLGGITRKVTLFAVPEVHITRLHLHTTFGGGYLNAVLHVEVEVANEDQASAEAIQVVIVLRDPSGRNVTIAPSAIDFGNLKPGQTAKRRLNHRISKHQEMDNDQHNICPFIRVPACRLAVLSHGSSQRAASQYPPDRHRPAVRWGDELRRQSARANASDRRPRRAGDAVYGKLLHEPRLRPVAWQHSDRTLPAPARCHGKRRADPIRFEGDLHRALARRQGLRVCLCRQVALGGLQND